MVRSKSKSPKPPAESPSPWQATKKSMARAVPIPPNGNCCLGLAPTFLCPITATPTPWPSAFWGAEAVYETNRVTGMKDYPEPIDLKQVKVYPLADRQSLSCLDKLLVDPEKPPPDVPSEILGAVTQCVR